MGEFSWLWDYPLPHVISLLTVGYWVELNWIDSLPIAYANQQMSKVEQSYSTTEWEYLMVDWVDKHFRCYLHSRFTIIMDHMPLKWLMNMKDPTSWLACWNLKLQDYDFDIIHRPGIQQTAIQQHGLPEPILNWHNIREVQRADSRMNQMIATLEQDELIEPFFLDNDGILFRKDSSERSSWRREVFEQILVPSSL